MRDSVLFYRSFYEAINEEENPEKRLAAYEAIFKYALDEIEPENLKGIAKATFILAKPQIDANNKKHTDGCKGGRPKKTTGYEDIKTTGYENRKPNENENVNENEKENENINIKRTQKPFEAPDLESVMGYCREFCKSKGYEIDAETEAEKFIDFYDSKDWRVGKNKMVDWKSSVRNWIRNENQRKNDKKIQSNENPKARFAGEREYNFEELTKDLIIGGKHG